MLELKLADERLLLHIVPQLRRCIMKRVQMFGDARLASGNAPAHARDDSSRFAPMSKSPSVLWTALRKNITKLFDRTRNTQDARARSQINGTGRIGLDVELHNNGRRVELEILGEAIAALARQIGEKTQQTTIIVEEASLALHFRKTKAEIGRALALLERQVRAKRSGLEGHWVLLL
jgi:hypothetical protein